MGAGDGGAGGAKAKAKAAAGKKRSAGGAKAKPKPKAAAGKKRSAGGAKPKAKAAAGKRRGAGGAKPKAAPKKKLTSREIDEKYINRGMMMAEYIMGERDTMPPVADWTGCRKGSAKAQAKALDTMRTLGALRAAHAARQDGTLKGFNTGGGEPPAAADGQS